MTSFDIITGMEIMFGAESVFRCVSWLHVKKGHMKCLPWCQLTVYVKKDVCTDIDSIYHSGTDKFVTGLHISFYLTYMGSHDSWKEVYYEYSPIIYHIACISLGRGSRGNRYFLYKDIYRSAIGVQISFCKTCIVNP